MQPFIVSKYHSFLWLPLAIRNAIFLIVVDSSLVRVHSTRSFSKISLPFYREQTYNISYVQQASCLTIAACAPGRATSTGVVFRLLKPVFLLPMSSYSRNTHFQMPSYLLLCHSLVF